MNFKNLTIIASLIVINSFLFNACSKEENIENQNQKNAFNQFEWVGEMHNEILWEIGSAFQDDLHDIVVNNGISESDAIQLYEKMKEWETSQLSSTLGSYDISLYWNIDVEESANRYMTDVMFNHILDEATSMDDLLVIINRYEDSIYSNLLTIDDSITLFSLIIMEYSLDFWMDAYYNLENPWHEITYYMPPLPNAKNLPETWHNIKNWIHNKVSHYIGEVVTAAVEFVGMDYITWKAIAESHHNINDNNFSFGVAIGTTAVASAIGGVNGWNNPWF